MVLILNKTVLTSTSLRMIEKIFESEDLMKALKVNVVDAWWTNYKESKSSWLGSLFAGKTAEQMDREMLIHKTAEMVQLWADLTMMYQGDFMTLALLYRDLRQMKVPFPGERNKRYFDDLRQLQINNPIFSDVIIF